MINRFALPLAAALAVMAGWSWTMQQRGVDKERARVVKSGETTHAKASSARKKVEAKPPSELQAHLRSFCVDCK